MLKRKSTRFIDIIYLQLSVLLLSLSGIFAKMASSVSFVSVNFFIYYGIMLFIIGIYAIIWQQIIKKFKIFVAYINKATLIIWTFIWAVIFFRETITINNIIGAIFVVAGIVVVLKDDK